MSSCSFCQDKVMFITDPVHGMIPLSPLQKDLVETVEFQRLNAIHQLGMAHQVYPSAHCMRFAHALGVSHLAQEIGLQLILNNSDLDLTYEKRVQQVLELTAAGLLHDICHTPWSHTLEPLYLEMMGGTHMDAVKAILSGKMQMPIKGAGTIPSILSRYGLDPSNISDLINKKYQGRKYLQQIIFGEIDADTLDYLKRDFHYTGVSFGHVDTARIIQTMCIDEGRLCFKEKGLQAVRNFLNARIEMYSAVYLHKKSRISDSMLLRAAKVSILENKEFPNFWAMTDDELLSAMMNYSQSEYTQDIAWRLKYRQNLFKQVFHIDSENIRESDSTIFRNIFEKSGDTARVIPDIEAKLCKFLEIPKGYLIIDLVGKVTDISETRFKDLDIVFVEKNGRKRSLRELDSVFYDYIRKAQPSRSILSIYTPEEYAERFSDFPSLIKRIGM